MKYSQKKFIKSITADSISILLKEAEENFSKHPERALRYVKMVWALVKKHKVRLKHEQKIKFCKKCFILWIPHKTVTINFDKCHNMFEFVCISCDYKKRFK